MTDPLKNNTMETSNKYCFRLTKEEAEIIRSQIATLNPEAAKQRTWWRHLPRVFTEQGVAMLSAVLSKRGTVPRFPFQKKECAVGGDDGAFW